MLAASPDISETSGGSRGPRTGRGAYCAQTSAPSVGGQRSAKSTHATSVARCLRIARVSRGDPESRARRQLLHVFEAAGVPGECDQPAVVLLHVLVGVEGRAANEDGALRIEDEVFERPRAAGGGGRDEVELGMVDAVAREEARPPHRRHEEAEDRLAAFERIFAVTVGRTRVVGEALSELGPALLIQTPHVSVLEALDGLDLA